MLSNMSANQWWEFNQHVTNKDFSVTGFAFKAVTYFHHTLLLPLCLPLTLSLSFSLSLSYLTHMQFTQFFNLWLSCIHFCNHRHFKYWYWFLFLNFTLKCLESTKMSYILIPILALSYSLFKYVSPTSRHQAWEGQNHK